jgi:hypothetical protein
VDVPDLIALTRDPRVRVRKRARAAVTMSTKQLLMSACECIGHMPTGKFM